MSPVLTIPEVMMNVWPLETCVAMNASPLHSRRKLRDQQFQLTREFAEPAESRQCIGRSAMQAQVSS